MVSQALVAGQSNNFPIIEPGLQCVPWHALSVGTRDHLFGIWHNPGFDRHNIRALETSPETNFGCAGKFDRNKPIVSPI